MRKLFRVITFIALVMLTFSVSGVYAADYSFTGSFTYDNDVQIFDFTVGAPSTVTLRTWSYAGGTDAAGQVIPRGGFDPILALFDSTGAYINQNDDGGALVPADAVTGAHYDTYLQVALAAGNYEVSVMQYNNFANGPNLSNGFAEGSNTNFTQNWSGGNPGYFYDVNENERTGNWEFDILNVNQAAVVTGVPEPTTMLLLGLGLVGLAGARRKFK